MDAAPSGPLSSEARDALIVPSLPDRASLTAAHSTPSSAPPSVHTAPSPHLSEYSPTFPDEFSPGPLMMFLATLRFDGPPGILTL